MKAIGRFLAGVGRLLVLPFKLLGAAVVLAFRAGVAVARIPVRLSAAAGRLLGFRGIIFGLLGLALGLLFAPGPGRDLRDRLRQLIQGGGVVADDELVDKVVFELAHAPRTWHLEPQPSVAVVAGRVTLTGPVVDEKASEEFARVAGSVPGVTGVDNHLAVAPSEGEASEDAAVVGSD